jgi:hypothetical protein
VHHAKAWTATILELTGSSGRVHAGEAEPGEGAEPGRAQLVREVVVAGLLGMHRRVDGGSTP